MKCHRKIFRTNTSQTEPTEVQYQGRWRTIKSYVHIMLSEGDLGMVDFISAPIHILYNRSVYQVDGTYNYQRGMYNFKNLGFW